jgi:hypothetical protein
MGRHRHFWMFCWIFDLGALWPWGGLSWRKNEISIERVHFGEGVLSIASSRWSCKDNPPIHLNMIPSGHKRRLNIEKCLCFAIKTLGACSREAISMRDSESIIDSLIALFRFPCSWYWKCSTIDWGFAYCVLVNISRCILYPILLFGPFSTSDCFSIWVSSKSLSEGFYLLWNSQ